MRPPWPSCCPIASVPRILVDHPLIMTLQYDVAVNPPSELLDAIERGLHHFNVAFLGEEVIRDYERLAVVARDVTGEIIGGVHGELCWDWLYVKTMWVGQGHRCQGIGTTLLTEIEMEALSRGIARAHLETTDFQALGFYVKNGYEVFGQLEGKPTGYTWYYLKKQLSPTLD